MNKLFKLSASTMLTLSLGLLASCTDEDEASVSTGAPMSVSVQSDAYARGVLIEDAFQAGAQIGVFLTEEDKTTYNDAEYHNLHYTFTDGTWNIDDPLKTPKLTDVEGKAVAYHPWNNTVTDYTQVPVTTAEQKDFMYSGWTEGINNADSEAAFTMKHALTGIRLLVKKTADYRYNATLTSVNVQSDAFYVSATMDATDGSLGNLATPGAALEQTGLSINLTTAGEKLDFIVVAGTEREDIDFTATINGKQYVCTAQLSAPLEQGHIHTFTLMLTPVGLALDGIGVNEWEEGEGEEMELKKPLD